MTPQHRKEERKMEVGQITYNHKSKCYELLGEDLRCGDSLEVLVCNGLNGGAPEWIETRYEMDSEDVGYLVGLIGYQISGLFAKRGL